MINKRTQQQPFISIAACSFLLLYSIAQLCIAYSQTIDKQNLQETQYHSLGFTDALVLSSNSERLQIPGKNNPVVQLKSALEQIRKSEPGLICFSDSIFKQYRFYTQHIIRRLVQSDIIFPFHYFW